MQYVRYSVRVLLKSPGFTLVAVVALALGIGANTAIFSLIDTVLLRPLPYAHPDQLVEISEKSPQYERMPVAYPDYVDWRAAAGCFEGMAISATFGEILTWAGPAEKHDTAYVSGNFFGVLGVRPLLGRGLLPEDDQPNARPVAVLTHAFWQTRFGGDRAILGRQFSLNGVRFDIVGVLPASFRYHHGGDVYVPFALSLKDYGMVRGNHNNSWVIARLKPGVSLEHAKARMDTISRRLEREYPMNSGIGAFVIPLRELLSGGARRQFMVLLGVVGLVLLIACANVANLMLARSVTRRKEMAIRTALGAARGRIIVQLLTESLLVACAGAGFGLLLAQIGFRTLAALLPWGFAPQDLRIDLPVLAFTAGAACLAGLAFGLAPAIQVSAVSLSEAMKEGGKGSVQGRGTARLRSALVVAEVALAVILLAGAGLLMRSLYRLLSVDPGYRGDNLLTVRLDWPYRDRALANRAVDFYERSVERARALPGVRAAGGVNWLGMAGDGFSSAAFYRLDRPLPAQGQVPDAAYHTATSGYFATLGIPLLRGRLFSEADGRLPPITQENLMQIFLRQRLAAVVNQSMARKFWPGEDPVGKQFRFGPPGMDGPLVTIVGIVGDIRQHGLNTPPQPEFYLSALCFPTGPITLVLRTHSNPLAILPALRKAIAGLDPNVPLTRARSMEAVIAESVAPRRMNLLLIGGFAGLALVLSAVGLYGVLSYTVAQRTHEIGIRMALGAAAAEVVGGVLREALGLTAAGIAIGVAGGLALTRILSSMLYGVAATDPATFAAVSLLLLAVALAASYVPARRATRVDPVVALRCQ
jgi:putative ABC transport system permease protein